MRSEEPHDLYTSPNISVMKSRKVRWARHVACMTGKGNACRGLCGKPEGMKLFGRQARWEDHIKVDLKEIGWQGVDLIHQAQFRDWEGRGYSCKDLLPSQAEL